jgi:glycosyltransferase involved in cell wall biosynthesis
MTKIDILLPYWGDVELLKQAVESVLAQTEEDWRLLVFDDGYPSEEPARYFAQLKDSRVSYYRHKKNVGITKNFNYALGAAQAKYCVMFGYDDLMLPGYLKTALENIKDADLYQPSVDIIDAKGSIYLPLSDRIKRVLRPKKAGLYSGEKLASSLSRGNWLYFPSIVWKTAVIKKYGFDEQFKIVEDVALELNIIKDGGKLSLDNHTTFRYRRFSDSLSSREKSSKGGVRFNEENNVYDYFAKEFTKHGWKKAARSAKLHITSRLHQFLTKI